jgi:hypothetical protein
MKLRVGNKVKFRRRGAGWSSEKRPWYIAELEADESGRHWATLKRQHKGRGGHWHHQCRISELRKVVV